MKLGTHHPQPTCGMQGPEEPLRESLTMLNRLSKEIERTSQQVVRALIQSAKIVAQYVKHVATQALMFVLETYFEIENLVSKLLGGCMGIIYALRQLVLISLLPFAFFYFGKPVFGVVALGLLLGLIVYAVLQPDRSIQVTEDAALFFVKAARVAFRVITVLISIAITYLSFSGNCQSQASFQCGVKRMYVAAYGFVSDKPNSDEERDVVSSKPKADDNQADNSRKDRGYLFAEMLPISHLIATTNTEVSESRIRDVEQYFQEKHDDFRSKRIVDRSAFNLMDEQEIRERRGRIALITEMDQFFSEVEKNGLLNADTADEMADSFGAKGKYMQARILSLHAVSVGQFNGRIHPGHWITLSQAEFGYYAGSGDELLAERYAIGVFLVASHLHSALPGFCERLRKEIDSASGPVAWRLVVLKWRSKLLPTSNPVLHRCLV